MAWKDGETISPLGLNRIEEAVASMNESYTPTVWEVGDVITAEKLNKIEEGIAGVQPTGKKEITSIAEVNVSSYVTAQVVDEDLVAGNIKKDVDILGVVGSYEAPASDFSTAEVTITGVDPGINLTMPVIRTINNTSFISPIAGANSTPQTVLVPLYDGKSILLDDISEYHNVSLTGAIEYDEDFEAYIITGDCSITLTALN